MKKSIVVAVFLITVVNFSFAQNFQLKGLEIYNPVYSNPAFTSSEKLIQTDLIANDMRYYNGFWFNAMSSIPNTNSSVGLNIAGSKYYNSYGYSGSRVDENIFMRGKSIGLSYAYKYSFTEHLDLSGGINFTHSISKFSDTLTNLNSWNTGFINTGLKLSYRKLYAGISAGLGLYKRDERSSETNEPEVTWDKFNSFSSNFVAGYSLGGQRRVNFDPIIGFRYVRDFTGDNADFGFYAGGNITIVKTVGLGFTVGDMFSLSSSITILDRVSLKVGIYQTERSVTLSTFDYTLGFDPVEYIAQLRIKL